MQKRVAHGNAHHLIVPLTQAADESRITVPSNMVHVTVWIDPREVSFRCGEAGAICHIPLHTAQLTGNDAHNASRSISNAMCGAMA